MLLTKEVEVKLLAGNVEHYKSLGYEIPMRPASEYMKKIKHKDFVYDIGSTILVKLKIYIKIVKLKSKLFVIIVVKFFDKNIIYIKEV